MPDTESSRPSGAAQGGASADDALMSVVKLALESVASRAELDETVASEAFIQGLCTLLVAREQAAAETLVRSRIARRQSYAELADGILAACARELGARWDTDQISFADMALGVTELHKLHQKVGRRYVPLSRALDVPYALFATLPRQRHTFGIILAAEAFRRAGWQVDLRLDEMAKDIIERVRRLRPDAFGVTVSRVDPPQPLRLLIGQVQKLPFPVPVLIGGGAADALRDSLSVKASVSVVQDIDSALRAVQPDR
ncbi:cobalamin B12-binding domain-containing protein [Dinoroseobacter sp. S124A]|uniref:cobalamin B12-binding domain-containing protein n=1 Tax=Dinoroseobacter sp. S124A TaxID=3415128 RepID=UPI003C7BB059